MKKILKKALCVFLVVILMSTGYFFSTYFRYSRTFNNELEDNFFGTLFVDYPIWEFYSKTPNSYIPNNTKKDFDVLSGDSLYYVTFVDYKRKSGGQTEEFYFKVNGDLSQNGMTSPFFDCGDKLKIKNRYRNDEHKYFYSEITCMLSYYGVEFKPGKEYLISFVPTIEYIKGETDYALFTEPYVYAPLDEEYPYIEVYPGAIRYDATYFGADSKYVTKEEFIELLEIKIKQAPPFAIA